MPQSDQQPYKNIIDQDGGGPNKKSRIEACSIVNLTDHYDLCGEDVVDVEVLQASS